MGPLNIRVSILTPGMTRTDTVMGWVKDEDIPRWVSEFPIRRLGDPEEIAGGGIYLAAPAAGSSRSASSGGVDDSDRRRHPG